MRTAKEAAEAWKAAAPRAAANYRAGLDPIEKARRSYIYGELSVEEFEAEVGKLLAEAG